MQPRTKRQKEIFDYIKQYIERHGYQPSYQQIARHLNISSKGGIAKHIHALEKQGLLERNYESGSFKLEINPTKSILEVVCEIEWLELPSNENYAENWEKDFLFVPKFLIGHHSPAKIRAFRVLNNAMLEKHILEGDVALIKKTVFARDGDIIVALLEKKRAVLKQFYRSGANVELRPANENYDSIILPADQIEIKGILQSILRPAD